MTRKFKPDLSIQVIITAITAREIKKHSRRRTLAKTTKRRLIKQKGALISSDELPTVAQIMQAEKSVQKDNHLVEYDQRGLLIFVDALLAAKQILRDEETEQVNEPGLDYGLESMRTIALSSSTDGPEK